MKKLTPYTQQVNQYKFMGSDTKDVIDKLFSIIYKHFNKRKKHQVIMEANLFLKVLNYYIIFKEQTLEELNHT